VAMPAVLTHGAPFRAAQGTAGSRTAASADRASRLPPRVQVRCAATNRRRAVA
jgi:hypothetical protein